MFMVGVAMPFAFARRTALGDSWSRQFRHTLIRAFNLALIGILLDHFGANKIQIGFIRVLQQIFFKAGAGTRRLWGSASTPERRVSYEARLFFSLRNAFS